MKILKRVGIVLVILAALFYIASPFLTKQTKKASPEATVEYTKDDIAYSIFYNRPSKKDRVIFGDLVPFGKVWRTGANEATTFETNKDLKIGGNTLGAGKYTLWSIPEADKWTVIFNNKMYGWGVGFNGASRKAEFDVLEIEVPVQPLTDALEMFTISFGEDSTGVSLDLAWDQTKVSVPLH